MKNFYYAITAQEDGFNYAFVLTIPQCDNLLSALNGYKNLHTVNACATKKEAFDWVEHFNDCFRNNGTYYFDNYFKMYGNDAIEVAQSEIRI